MVNLVVGFHCVLLFFHLCLLFSVGFCWICCGLTIPTNGQSCCWFSLLVVVFLLVFVGFRRCLLDLRGLTIPANGQSCCWFLLCSVVFVSVFVVFRLFFVGFAGA